MERLDYGLVRERDWIRIYKVKRNPLGGDTVRGTDFSSWKW